MSEQFVFEVLRRQRQTHREVQSGTLAIRGRSGANLGSMTIAGALDLLRADLKPAGRQQTMTQ